MLEKQENNESAENILSQMISIFGAEEIINVLGRKFDYDQEIKKLALHMYEKHRKYLYELKENIERRIEHIDSFYDDIDSGIGQASLEYSEDTSLEMAMILKLKDFRLKNILKSKDYDIYNSKYAYSELVNDKYAFNKFLGEIHNKY